MTYPAVCKDCAQKDYRPTDGQGVADPGPCRSDYISNEEWEQAKEEWKRCSVCGEPVLPEGPRGPEGAGTAFWGRHGLDE